MNAVTGIIEKFQHLIIVPAMEIIFAAGLFLFVWGLVIFLWSLDEGSAHTTGRWHMVYGLVGMFIMVSIWGILSIVTATFGFSPNPNANGAFDPGRAAGINAGFQFK